MPKQALTSRGGSSEFWAVGSLTGYPGLESDAFTIQQSQQDEKKLNLTDWGLWR